MAKTIMFLGTGSDVGKSIVATAFCRIFKRQGFSVAPFKAQNMSNNSYITAEGGEIGRAQVAQAEAAGLIPSNDMNPVLLKPTSNLGSQIVLQGRVHGQMKAAQYHDYKKQLVNSVMESYHRLAQKYEVVVLEGAGSCVEINLKANDIVNFAMAKRAKSPAVLVADIDRGGVFAQVLGSFSLLTPKEKSLTAGFIINKFRGDPALFEDGLDIIKRKSKRDVFGLVPFYDHIHIDPEDSVAVQADKHKIETLSENKINIAVIRLPGISNFTDMEALKLEPDTVVNFLEMPQTLKGYDLLILPGSKSSLEDAAWLKKTGWDGWIKKFALNQGMVIGLCGGYQLMGREIHDPHMVESKRGRVKGLGLLPLNTTMAKEKVLRRVEGTALGSRRKIIGYEIHMGKTLPTDLNKLKPFLKLHEPGKSGTWQDGWVSESGRVMGTYVHGLFDSPTWRGGMLNSIRRKKNISEIKRPIDFLKSRDRQYDLLADHFEKHTNVKAIMKHMGL